jgi:uncharacterized membrane protein YfcA
VVATALLTHLGEGTIDARITALVVAGGLVGILVGSRLAGRLAEPLLRRGFAGLVVALAAVLLLQNHLAITSALGAIGGLRH